MTINLKKKRFFLSKVDLVIAILLFLISELILLSIHSNYTNTLIFSMLIFYSSFFIYSKLGHEIETQRARNVMFCVILLLVTLYIILSREFESNIILLLIFIVSFLEFTITYINCKIVFKKQAISFENFKGSVISNLIGVGFIAETLMIGAFFLSYPNFFIRIIGNFPYSFIETNILWFIALFFIFIFILVKLMHQVSISR